MSLKQFTCRNLLTLVLFVFLGSSAVLAQGGPATAAGGGPGGNGAPAFDARPFLPRCSTEKINGNCFLNIDRRFPVAMPTIQMRKGAHVTVYVFYPFVFEALTLDAGVAQAIQGSDQASALLTAVAPVAKGAVFGVNDAAAAHDFLANMEGLKSRLGEQANQPNPPRDTKLADKIRKEIEGLDKELTETLEPVTDYITETGYIYAQVREMESAAPRTVVHVHDPQPRGFGVPAGTPNPWEDYANWRQALLDEITQQGEDTSDLLDRLPGPCQKKGDPAPAPGPWVAPARPCPTNYTTPQGSDDPLGLPDDWEQLHAQMESDWAALPTNQPDPQTYRTLRDLKQQLDQREARVERAINACNDLLPALIGKVSTDMQTLEANIGLARGAERKPVMVGIIPDPASFDRSEPEHRLLAPYNALGRQVTYTVNAQNEVANSLLGLPVATQKQAVVTITVLFADPRFEISSGAFFSWLPNRTFSNFTDVTVTGGVPAPADIKIDVTKSNAPEIIPFVAANYRLGQQFTWLGRRRGALYGTLGIGLNPYNTQVEYAAGFSVSWRYLMFSPLYHLGHGVHLTQGESVGQIWCQYGNGATATSNPPLCAGGPPAPSTKNYWTGTFALGVSVRIPTSFSASGSAGSGQ